MLPRKLASVFVRAAHDPPKCERFGDQIMRFSKRERDRTQNRLPLLLIALACAASLKGWAVSGFKSEPASGSFVHDMF
jgi:hypothetical protein